MCPSSTADATVCSLAACCAVALPRPRISAALYRSFLLWISELTGLGLGVRTAARASWDEDM